MQVITRLAIKKLIAQPELKDNSEFWLDFAVRVLESIQFTLDEDTDAFEEVEEFLDIIPSMLVSRAETNFNYLTGEGAYPVLLEVVERGKN